MSTDEARRIVQLGLDRRKKDRQVAVREARLEKYEQDQIRFCNENCAGARLKRNAELATRRSIEEAAARKAARAAEAARQQELEDKTMAAVRYYGLTCLAVLWMCAVTRFPVWAAVTLIAGLAVFPAAYIFRLYFPLEG